MSSGRICSGCPRAHDGTRGGVAGVACLLVSSKVRDLSKQRLLELLERGFAPAEPVAPSPVALRHPTGPKTGPKIRPKAENGSKKT